jgi:histone-lysine N-methyltransferase SETD8
LFFFVFKNPSFFLFLLSENNSITLAKTVLHDDNNESISTLRRSKRQLSKQLGITKYKSATSFDSFIETQCEDGLEARHTGTVRGRGVYTTKKFFRNDYIVEYAGELLTQAEAKHRENLYGHNHNIGCYMYYFKWGEKVFCVDATEETNRLG